MAGATGFTGREVVRQLCERGVATVAHVRPDSHQLSRWKHHFSDMGAQVDTTPWHAEALTSRLNGLNPSLVYALLGTTQKRMRAMRKAGEQASYDSIDFGLTKQLYDAACSTGGNPRFIYLSSMGAGGKPTGSYMQARVKTEAMVLAGTLPYIIARPSFIVGARDQTRWGENIGATIVDAALTGIGMFGATRTRDKYRSQSNTTLAHALVSLGLSKDAANRIVESDELQNA